MTMRYLLIGFALSLVGPVYAMGQDALVEEAPASSGLAPFQFLSEGDAYALDAGEVVVIGYFASCARERIEGGAFTIGAAQSVVSGGSVERETLPCGRKTTLSDAQRQESGASAWRRDEVRETPAAVFNLSPVLVFSSPASAVLIERTDVPARPVRLSAAGETLDLVERGVMLAPGGVYTISAGPDRRVVEVDFDATEAGGPYFLRVVRF